MSILVQSPDWAYCTSNLPSTPSASAVGTSVTCGANNVKGSAVSVFTLAHDVENLVIGFANSSSPSGVNNSCLIDILIDPAGGTSWSVLIPDLLAGFTTQTGTTGSPFQRSYYFPLWIPSGAAIGLKGQTAHSSTFIVRGTLFAMGGNRNPSSWWCGQSVTSYGINSGGSSGALHTAGNSGSYSSWTTVAASTADHKAFNVAIQGVSTTTQNANAYNFQFGVGGTQLGQTIYKNTATNETSYEVYPGPIYASVPSGTNLQIRGTSSGTADALDVAIYGIS